MHPIEFSPLAIAICSQQLLNACLQHQLASEGRFAFRLVFWVGEAGGESLWASHFGSSARDPKMALHDPVSIDEQSVHRLVIL